MKVWRLELQKDPQNEIEWLREIAADLVLVMAYGHILSQEFLRCAPPVVTICMHLFYQNTEELLQLKQPWQTARKDWSNAAMRMVRKWMRAYCRTGNCSNSK